jgi:hypothetical protein
MTERCPACETEVTTEWIDEPLRYGLGRDAVVLATRVPLRHCPRCKLDFTDHIAENIRERTVRKHIFSTLRRPPTY